MPTRTEAVVFENHEGHTLSARLEWPAGPPAAFVIFAHCFTCSKQSQGALRISRALAREGFAVLRFDFTGLGESEGEFSKTTLSSNVSDLVAAAEFLRMEYGPPRMLVGHSLGGAAVLAGATQIEEIEAVVTIGAPASPGHVKHLLADGRDAIEREGQADVNIGGRTVSIGKQFLDDVDAFDRKADLEGRALLILHSPVDEVVGIENAERLYQSVRGYKSFVTLENADHLMSKKEDAEYAASVIAAWSGRYVTRDVIETAPEAAAQVTVEELGELYANRVVAGRHELIADEPVKVGGKDAGPDPYAYLLAALGACTTMTVRMYANRKELPLDKVTVHLEHGKIHAADCEDCETKDGKIDHFERRLVFEGDLTDEQRQRLVEISEKCPVHRTLLGEKKIVTTLVE